MGQHHALGVACGAGGKQNLQRRLARKASNWRSFFVGQRAGPVLESKPLIFGGQLMKQQRIAHRQLGLHVGGHARGKLRCPVSVQRHHQHAARDATVEGRNPLRAIFSP